MTRPRVEVVGATTAITRRTTLRKAFLAPWHPLVEQCWLYSLAYAQSQTGVAVHLSTLVVNHHHTNVTPSAPNLPEFTRRFHHDLSRSINALLCRERYDSPRELFDDRQTHHLRLLDAVAQASHLLYEHLNPVAAGLVARPEHMPIRQLDFRLWKTGYIDVERPDVYFDPETRPRIVRLHLTPPPLLYRAFDGNLDALVHHMQRLREEGLRSLRSRRKRPPMGARALRRLHPWSEPHTRRESGGRPSRTFRVGARGTPGRELERVCAGETARFREEHLRARLARGRGDLTRAYPYGTYGARVHLGAPVGHPHPDAVLVRPGPTLEEVRAEIAARSVSESAAERGRLPRRRDGLLEDVRSALSKEAADLAENADLDLRRGNLVMRHGAIEHVSQSNHVATHELMGVARLQGKRQGADHPSACRVVVLRDRRRGRPRRSEPRRRSDPPC